jgi:hypothetical protein
MTTEDFMFMFFGSNDNRRFRVLQKQQETNISCTRKSVTRQHCIISVICYINWDEKSLKRYSSEWTRTEDFVYFGSNDNRRFHVHVFRKQRQPNITCSSEATRNKYFVHAQKRNMSALHNYLLCYRNWDEKSLSGIVRKVIEIEMRHF